MVVHCYEFGLPHTSIHYAAVVAEIWWKMFGIPLGFSLGQLTSDQLDKRFQFRGKQEVTGC